MSNENEGAELAKKFYEFIARRPRPPLANDKLEACPDLVDLIDDPDALSNDSFVLNKQMIKAIEQKADRIVKLVFGVVALTLCGAGAVIYREHLPEPIQSPTTDAIDFLQRRLPRGIIPEQLFVKATDDEKLLSVAREAATLTCNDADMGGATNGSFTIKPADIVLTPAEQAKTPYRPDAIAKKLSAMTIQGKDLSSLLRNQSCHISPK